MFYLCAPIENEAGNKPAGHHSSDATVSPWSTNRRVYPRMEMGWAYEPGDMVSNPCVAADSLGRILFSFFSLEWQFLSFLAFMPSL